MSALTVLLIGNYRPTVTLARVLSRKGHRILCGLEGHEGGTDQCRYVDKAWDHPSVVSEPEKFLPALSEFVQQENIDVVFPVTEEAVILFSKHLRDIESFVAVAMAKPDLIATCLNKMQMMKLAQSLEVPTAPFGQAFSIEELESASDATGFPLVVRPEQSTRRIHNKKAYTFESKSELADTLGCWDSQWGSLIYQRYVTGKRHNVYFAAHQGEVFRQVEAVILRTDMPDGSGLAVLGKTCEPNIKLQQYTEQLVKALDYTGIGCAQYLVNQDTGEISFLEINPRIGGNHNVPESAGLELSSVLIDLALNKSLKTSKVQGKTDLTYHWLTGDVMGAKIAWLRKEISTVQLITWILRAFRDAASADIHMLFSWRDPKPWLHVAKAIFPSFGGLKRQLKQRLSLQSQHV